jgi:O-antigen/teichoic acid export membrane protein
MLHPRPSRREAEVLRNFLIYGLGGAASRLAAVFLVPLYTRGLSVADYGTLELLLALHMGAVLLAGLQSESAILRDYYGARSNSSRKALIWSGLGISLAGSAAFAALALLAAALDLLPAEVAPYVGELIALTALAQVLGIQLIVLRCAGRATFFAFVALLDFALAALASALLILQLDLGLHGALWGILCGKVVASALAYTATFGRPPARLRHRRLVGRMLIYAVPTLPSVMLNWAQTNGARVLLAAFFTLQDVAVVSVAMRVAAIYGFVVQSFRLAWEPHAFAHLDGRSADPRFYERALQLYSFPMLLAAGGAMLVGPVLVAVFAPPAYGAAVPLVGFFVAGHFWLGAISILAMGIHGARITGKLTKVYGAGAAVNAVLLLSLAPRIGIVAAAAGFLASTIIAAALAGWYSNRHYRTGFSFPRLALLAVLTSIQAGAAYLLLVPVDLLAFDWAAYAWRTAALLAVLTLCLGSLIASFDDDSKSALLRSFRSVTARLSSSMRR